MTTTAHDAFAVDTDGTTEILDAELVDDTLDAEAAALDVPFDRRGAVVQLLVLRQLTDYLKELDAGIRKQLAPHLEVGDNLAGALNPADPKGTALGKVGMNNGRETVDVTDLPALLA